MLRLVGHRPVPPQPAALREELGRLVDLPGPDDPGWTELPPHRSIDERMAELPVVQRLAADRTPEGNAWAEHLDTDGMTTAWKPISRQMREEIGGVRGWAAVGAMRATAAAALVLSAVRAGDHELRPFQMPGADVEVIGDKPPGSSFPSTHATVAYAEARFASRMAPRVQAPAYDLASQVAGSRVYAAAHLPLDVQAGANYGNGIGDAAAGAMRFLGVRAQPLEP